MRKLYLMPYHIIHEHAGSIANDFTGGVHWLPINGAEVGLENALYIVSIDFVSEHHEGLVLDEEEVIELPCPQQEGHKTLKEHVEDDTSRYQQEHHDMLKRMFVRASLNLEDHHTIFDVSEMVQKLHGSVKIGRIKRQHMKK